MDTFQISWIHFRLSRHFFIIRIILRWYGRRPFRSSKHFSDHPDPLQIIPTIFAKFSFSATIHWSPSFESDKTKRSLFIQPTKLPRTSDFWMDQTFRCKFWNGSKHCSFLNFPPDFKGCCYVHLFENSWGRADHSVVCSQIAGFYARLRRRGRYKQWDKSLYSYVATKWSAELDKVCKILA